MMPQPLAGRSALRALPNALSGLRLVLAGAFPFVPVEWRLGVIAASAASDGIDGVLARRLNATSFTGAMLDAIGDKVFVAVVIGTFVAEGAIGAWPAAIMLAREVTVAMIALYVIRCREWTAFRKMRSRWPGKATTVLQFTVILAALLRPEALVYFVAAAAGMSVLTAGLHWIEFAQEWRARRRRLAAGLIR
jgi:phosphatidylglycerophosphate synthase